MRDCRKFPEMSILVALKSSVFLFMVFFYQNSPAKRAVDCSGSCRSIFEYIYAVKHGDFHVL
jgi:hypothetical protein